MKQTDTAIVPTQKGNQSDFIRQLYQQYGRKLLSYAVHTWKLDEDKAWDLIYKTLYKVEETHASYEFESEEKFASFIFRVFLNLIRNEYRDRKEIQLNVMDDLSSLEAVAAEDAKDELTSSKHLRVLQAELEKMEDWQRILLLMRSDGRPYSEIAKYVQKPEDQLKVYYQRLKKIITDKVYEQL